MGLEIYIRKKAKRVKASEEDEKTAQVEETSQEPPKTLEEDKKETEEEEEDEEDDEDEEDEDDDEEEEDEDDDEDSDRRVPESEQCHFTSLGYLAFKSSVVEVAEGEVRALEFDKACFEAMCTKLDKWNPTWLKDGLGQLLYETYEDTVLDAETCKHVHEVLANTHDKYMASKYAEKFGERYQSLMRMAKFVSENEDYALRFG
jgi:hypothetical protein